MPPKPPPMAALTTIANPLSPEKNKVMIFSNSKNYTLSLENRTIGGTYAASLGSNAVESTAPKLAYPSQLASFMYKDAVAVYGVTGADVDSLQVGLLSPVYAPDDTLKPVTGSLAGCSESADTAFLYMLAAEEDGGATKLMEYKLSDSDSNTNALKATDFDSKTNLFALYDETTKTRWIIYQKKRPADGNNAGFISVYSTKTGTDNIINESNSRCKNGTPITACIVPASGSRPARIYIYFLNSENILYSANSVIGDTLYFQTNDEKPSSVPNSPTVASYSQLASFLDSDKKRTIVYAVQSSGKVNPIYENWKTQ